MCQSTLRGRDKFGSENMKEALIFEIPLFVPLTLSLSLPLSLSLSLSPRTLELSFSITLSAHSHSLCTRLYSRSLCTRFVSLLKSFTWLRLYSRLVRGRFSSVFHQKLVKVSLLWGFHAKGIVFHRLNVSCMIFVWGLGFVE